MMRYSKYFVIVSAIAMFSRADAATVTGLATPNYVDGAIKSLSNVARTGSYDDLTNKPTFGPLATKDAVKNADVASDAAIAVSKISGAQTTENIVNPIGTDEEPGFNAGDMGSTTKYPSMKAAEQIATMVVSANTSEVNSKISDLETGLSTLDQKVEDALGDINGSLGKLATKDAVGSAEITDGSVAAADLASNSVTTAKIADKNVTKEKLEDSVQTSLGKADNSLQKATSATFTNGHVLKADASGNIVDGGALGALATKGTISNADVASDAAIAVSKISGAQTTANIVNKDANGSFAAGDATSTTKYPSMVAAKQIADTAAAGAVTQVSGDIEALEARLDALSATVNSNSADGAVSAKKLAAGVVAGGTNISVTRNESTGVFTVNNTYSLPNANGTTLGGVKTGGDMTASSGTLTISNGAVTAAKTSGVIGKLPSGGETSTTYAQMWVQ